MPSSFLSFPLGGLLVEFNKQLSERKAPSRVQETESLQWLSFQGLSWNILHNIPKNNLLRSNATAVLLRKPVLSKTYKSPASMGKRRGRWEFPTSDDNVLHAWILVINGIIYSVTTCYFKLKIINWWFETDNHQPKCFPPFQPTQMLL